MPALRLLRIYLRNLWNPQFSLYLLIFVIKKSPFRYRIFQSIRYHLICPIGSCTLNHMACVADITMLADTESRNYVRDSFEKVYGSLEGLNMKTLIFSEVSSRGVYRSWFGTLFVTVLASYSITLYFVLGYKIMASLNQGLDYRSDRTLQLQRRLFSALAIQTAISICVSFMPCIPVLYGSAIRIDFLSWVNRMSSVGVSFFPFLDSLAVTMCIPALRYRVFCRIRNVSPNLSNRVYSSSRI
ncbi:Protein CBG27340 [Caenorhabditis briggsae]|uniref:Protein CBG27340 n=1 Tax=Caenorhabditis briggsae TaxID=6238 RepID=B6IGE1_CAEBR|nr:Protein CBG27340 [Caenorhabditis briggsae]CAR98971.1 Protein CBG27340 [Caenorhabditis briggsae]